MPDTDRPKVWTARRRLLGNLLPLLPAIAAGTVVFLLTRGTNQDYDQILTSTTWALVAFCAAAWVGVALLGFIGNQAMRDALWKEYLRHSPTDPTSAQKWFVGYAGQEGTGLLDPHHDVGFLLLHRDEVEFFGDQERFRIPRPDVARLTFAPSVHSWVGLGRWVVVEVGTGKAKKRYRFEPRDRPTVIANLPLGRRLLTALRAWRGQP